MLSGTLADILFRNIISGKTKIPRQELFKAVKGTTKAGQHF